MAEVQKGRCEIAVLRNACQMQDKSFQSESFRQQKMVLYLCRFDFTINCFADFVIIDNINIDPVQCRHPYSITAFVSRLGFCPFFNSVDLLHYFLELIEYQHWPVPSLPVLPTYRVALLLCLSSPHRRYLEFIGVGWVIR
jgi:hypothetical protein